MTSGKIAKSFIIHELQNLCDSEVLVVEYRAKESLQILLKLLLKIYLLVK